MAKPRPEPHWTWRQPTAGLPELRSFPCHSPRSYTPRLAPQWASSRDPEGRAGQAAPEAGGRAVALESGSGNSEGNFQTGRPRVPGLAVSLPPRLPPLLLRWSASRTPPLASVWPLDPRGTGSREPAAAAPVRLRDQPRPGDRKAAPAEQR